MATRVVALLRGINVGRNKRVAMADLRALLLELGHTEVITHLQSGNAIFTSQRGAPTALAAEIEAALAGRLQVQSTVILRTAADLARVVSSNPLLDLMSDPARHLVGFLTATPDATAVRALSARDLTPDVVSVVGREVYLWCPGGVQDSAFTKVKWDRELGVAVTMRNWNTVTRLAELAAG